MHILKRFFIFLAKAITIIFTILAFGLLIVSLTKPEWIKIGISWIGELIKTLGNWNYLIAFLSACIESLPIIGTAFPGMNIMILVGGFWAKEHFFTTILLAILGAMLGNWLGYWIGKTIGKDILDKYGDYFGIGKTEEKIFARQLEKNGFWYIVLGKFHNFTRAFVPFLAGTGGMIERNFWFYNMIGSIIWASSINLLGIFFIDNYETILDHLGKIMLALIIGLFAYMFFFKKEFLREYMSMKQKEIEQKYEK